MGVLYMQIQKYNLFRHEIKLTQSSESRVWKIYLFLEAGNNERKIYFVFWLICPETKQYETIAWCMFGCIEPFIIISL